MLGRRCGGLETGIKRNWAGRSRRQLFPRLFADTIHPESFGSSWKGVAWTGRLGRPGTIVDCGMCPCSGATCSFCHVLLVACLLAWRRLCSPVGARVHQGASSVTARRLPPCRGASISAGTACTATGLGLGRHSKGWPPQLRSRWRVPIVRSLARKRS